MSAPARIVAQEVAGDVVRIVLEVDTFVRGELSVDVGWKPAKKARSRKTARLSPLEADRRWRLLQAALKVAGSVQAHLSKALGVAQPTVSNWLARRELPGTKSTRKLEAYLEAQGVAIPKVEKPRRRGASNLPVPEGVEAPTWLALQELRSAMALASDDGDEAAQGIGRRKLRALVKDHTGTCPTRWSAVVAAGVLLEGELEQKFKAEQEARSAPERDESEPLRGIERAELVRRAIKLAGGRKFLADRLETGLWKVMGWAQGNRPVPDDVVETLQRMEREEV